MKRSSSGVTWIRQRHVTAFLKDLAVAPTITHERLDELPGAQAIEISRSHDPQLIEAARTLVQAFEAQRGLRDLSPHLLALGRKPSR